MITAVSISSAQQTKVISSPEFANQGKDDLPVSPGISRKLNATEASSIWMQYMTAYGALLELGQLKQGEFVLITAASSSVGRPPWRRPRPGLLVPDLARARLVRAAHGGDLQPTRRALAWGHRADALRALRDLHRWWWWTFATGWSS